MRTIPNTLKQRLLSNLQTKANNANPYMEVMLLRQELPISDKRFWQETVVDTVQCTASSTAVRRTSYWRSADRAYVAYVYDGDLYVRTALLRYPIRYMSWSEVESVVDVVDCALDFNGSFVKGSKILYGFYRVEFVTEDTPWLFFVTAAGELKGGLLGGTYETFVGSGVTSVDVIKGIASADADEDQGLLLFYTLSGSLYYNALIDGEWQWQTAVSVTGLPATIVSVKAERTWDWRICLHIVDDTGKLYEVFTKMYVSGWAGREYLTADSRMTVDVLEVEYWDTKSDDEQINALAAMSVTVLWGISPIPIFAENVDNGEGDYGYAVRITFDHDVFDVSGNDTAFLMTDEYSSMFNSTSVIQISNRIVEIEFQNFNNASGEVSINYTPGTMLGEAGQPVDAFNFAFTPTGLVPFEVDPPVPVAFENIIDWEIT